MARSTMADLITLLRGMCDAGTADYTVASTAHWSDDQLEDALERHRFDAFNEEMTAQDEYTGGSVIYKSYYHPRRNFEGGTALKVLDVNGDAVSSSLYTADPLRGVIVFASNTAGASYYLSGACYDVESAAADVWRRKAAHYAQAYNISTDNQRLDRGQMIQAALQMAQIYDGQARPGNILIVRGDEWAR